MPEPNQPISLTLITLNCLCNCSFTAVFGSGKLIVLISSACLLCTKLTNQPSKLSGTVTLLCISQNQENSILHKKYILKFHCSLWQVSIYLLFPICHLCQLFNTFTRLKQDHTKPPTNVLGVCVQYFQCSVWVLHLQVWFCSSYCILERLCFKPKLTKYKWS